MDGFSEKLHQQIEASLHANENTGRPSLMMEHMQLLQKKKAEENLILDRISKEEEHMRQIKEGEDKKRRKKEKKKKRKKEKKERRKEKKKRRYENSSSSESSSDNDVESNLGDPIKATMALEKKKLEDLDKKRQEKKNRMDIKRRKLEEEEAADRESRQDRTDQERLREWQEAELNKKYSELSIKIIEGPVEAMQKTKDPDQESIPLNYFSQNKMVAWEYPGPYGVGISYAPLIGAPARDGGSDDEW